MATGCSLCLSVQADSFKRHHFSRQLVFGFVHNSVRALSDFFPLFGSSHEAYQVRSAWPWSRGLDTHLEAPDVVHLPAEVEVQLGDQEPIPGAGEPGGAAAVRGRHVARAVKVAEVLVSCGAATARPVSACRHGWSPHPCRGDAQDEGPHTLPSSCCGPEDRPSSSGLDAPQPAASRPQHPHLCPRNLSFYYF